MPVESEIQPAASVPQQGKFRRRLFLILTAFVVVALLGLVCLGVFLRPSPPIQMPLGDGRILQIEGVTFGTQHRMGSSSMLERFRPWLPNSLITRFGMDRLASTITLDRPGLVVWVNAISAITPTNVDCQMIRVEFVDRNGDVFGTQTSSWHGGQNFWRVGHVFSCYPRDERDLTLRVTTWKNGTTSIARIVNPRVFQTANWTGRPLPQSTNIGGMEILLTGLVVRTNGGKKKHWEAPVTWFEPVWECRQNGNPTVGWEKPEWFAEGPNGNRGQFLGTHQPALRFFATAYPEATNMQVAQLLTALPQTDLTTLTTNLWWNKTNSAASNEVVVLGMFPRGTHTFSEGNYESSSAAVLGPRGGASSGWTGRSQRITPLRLKETHSYYSPNPVLFIRVTRHQPDTSPFDHPIRGLPDESERLAVRLRDDHGQYWLAKSESAATGINPFLLELPPSVTNVVPEVVRLKPVQASFLVETKSYFKP